MTNEPTPAPAPLRYFQQNIFVDPASGRTLVERVYNNGDVEYWSSLVLQGHNGVQSFRAEVPFQIPIPDAFDIPGGETMEQVDFDRAMLSAARAAAWANFEQALDDAGPKAEEQVKQQFAREQKKANGKILIASAMPDRFKGLRGE